MKKSIIFIALFLSLAGCAQQKILFNKPDLTNEEFNRDKYDCVQQSKTKWGAGGTGGLGIALIIYSKSNADKQSAKLFKMCMEARGYTAREVSDEEFDRQKNTPLKIKLSQISKQRLDRCNNDDFKIIFIKSACRPENITLEQLADKSIISEDEKPFFSKFRSENTDSDNQTLEAMRTNGNSKDKEMGLVLERFYMQAGKDSFNLFEGKITWGEYNKSRKDIYQILQSERNRILGNK